MKSLLITIILSSTLTACGMDKAMTKAEQSNSDTSTDTSTDKAKDKTFETTASQDGKNNTQVIVQNNVTVTTGDNNPKKLEWHFVNARKPWYQAKQDAPSGFRLATRAEILGAAAKGALVDMGNVTVWTEDQSDDREDYIWTVSLKNSYPIVQYQESVFASLYVK